MTTIAPTSSPHPEPSPEPTGAGHEELIPGTNPDVGTRHPIRLSRRLSLSAIFTVARITAARQSRGIRLMIIALLFSLPIIIAVVVRQLQSDYRPEFVEGDLIFGLIVSALVPISALLFASGMVQDDIEEQTLTYFLIRPIPRWAIYLAKLLATFAVTALRAVVFTIATLVTLYWGEEDMLKTVLIERGPIITALLALSLSAYQSIFGCLSLLVRRTLVFGAIYIVVFEEVFANIDFVLREVTVMYYIRVLAVRWLDMPGVDWSIDRSTAPSSSTCLIVLLTISAVFTLLGAMTFGLREYRVKTPEGS